LQTFFFIFVVSLGASFTDKMHLTFVGPNPKQVPYHDSQGWNGTQQVLIAKWQEYYGKHQLTTTISYKKHLHNNKIA